MQKYNTVIKSGGFALTCPACGGTSQAEHKKKGMEKAVETCPHCKAKIEATYEPESDSWWDQQKVKAQEGKKKAEFLHLTESEQQELNKLATKTDDASLDRFCELLRKEAVTPDGTPWSQHELRESFRKMHPEWTEKQLDIATRGR